MAKNKYEGYLWHDRKRNFLGLPWSFTRYGMTNEKFLIDTGFFSRTEDEIRLYRILDVTLKRSFWERIFHMGTIHCCSGDKTQPEFDIKHIKNAKAVKDLLSDKVEEKRKERRVGMREYIDNDGDDHDEDDRDDD